MNPAFAGANAAVGHPTPLAHISKAAKAYIEELRATSPRMFTGERLFNLQKKLAAAVDAVYDSEHESDEEGAW